MHEGHRKRMLERLHQPDGLQDHELLEILLFNAVPRKNTNPLAHTLLNTFSSLEKLFSADYDQLLAVEGVGPETAAYLTCIGLLGRRIGGREEAPPRFNASDFSAFVRDRLSLLTEEVVELYAVDAQDKVSIMRRFSLTLPDRVEVDMEEINRFLAAQRPVGLVVAHNHPTAPALPSESDDRFTAQIQVACSMCKVRLYDHIIVGRGETYSYFLVGRMEDIRRTFNFTTIVGEKFHRGQS